MNSFTIQGRLPGLNELINANRSTRWDGARLKRRADNTIAWEIKMAMAAGECRQPAGPCRIHFEWHEATRRRDLDNIFSGKKYILDAMQRAGLLEGDGQKYVTGLSDTFILDKEERIIVAIEEDHPAPD